MEHNIAMAFAWWCAAGALSVLSAVLLRHEVAILSAANPNARLPWIGWPANRPRSAAVLLFSGTLATILAMNCVVEALNRRHLYDVLLDLPFLLLVAVVQVVPQVRHSNIMA
jgi:hypothetical protein